MAGQEAALGGTSVPFDPIYNRKIVTGNKKEKDVEEISCKRHKICQGVLKFMTKQIIKHVFPCLMTGHDLSLLYFPF